MLQILPFFVCWSCSLISAASVADSTPSAAPTPPCTGANKQKALYPAYDWGDLDLEASPATDISVETNWTDISGIRRYGKNGVFASSPVHFGHDPSGYFGSQVDGDPNQGGLLFSIWDSKRPKSDPALAGCSDNSKPNRTWCEHKHSFPISANCHRHCLDCGLHPGWHNTSGTQCGVGLKINEGDSFVFRLFKTSNASKLHNPAGLGKDYVGSEWTLTATKTSLDSTENEVYTVGSMFFEDSYEGVTRLGGFHEHIGCTQCSAFKESETRRGPWVSAPVARAVKSISFTRPNCSCQLFDVEPIPLAAGEIPAVRISTGPGTGPH